jgi:cytochrome c
MTIMIKLTKPIALLAAVSVLLLGTAGAQVAFGPVTGDAEKGKQFYYDYGCFGCHGFNGIGRHNLANDVSGIMSNETLYLTFLRARADLNPLFPTQNMPNYAQESLSDSDALDIYAYIRTFKDDPPAVEDIPALKAILDAAQE